MDYSYFGRIDEVIVTFVLSDREKPIGYSVSDQVAMVLDNAEVGEIISIFQSEYVLEKKVMVVDYFRLSKTFHLKKVE